MDQEQVKQAARILGSLGGRAKSERKTLANRVNGGKRKPKPICATAKPHPTSV
jgi:hypothetical protein